MLRLLLMRGTAVLVLVSVAAWAERQAGPVSPSAAGPSPDRASTFFSNFVFGGFRPLYVEYLWGEADRLETEGRYWEMLEVFRRIAKLDPENPRIWFHLGYGLGIEIAQREIDDEESWRWYRRATLALAAGIERHPGEVSLYRLLFNLYFNKIARRPEVDRRLRDWSRRDQERVGWDGLRWAAAIANEMVERFPERSDGRVLMLSSGAKVAESLLNRGFYDAGGKALEACLEQAEILAELAPSLSDPDEIEVLGFWAPRMRRLASTLEEGEGGDARIVDSEGFRALLEEIEVEFRRRRDLVAGSLEVELFSLIQFKVMRLCQLALLGEKAADALSERAWLNRISALTDGRFPVGKPYYSKSYIVRLAEFIELDEALLKVASEGGRPSQELVLRWERELSQLDQTMRERSSGGDDRFRKRMRERRPWGLSR